MSIRSCNDGLMSSSEDLELNDSVIIYSRGDCFSRSAKINTLFDLFKQSFVAVEFYTQFQVPSINNFSIPVLDNGSNVWLIMNPISSFENGSILLPNISKCVDGQEIIINCSMQVNNFSIDLNGAAAVSKPITALSPGASFRLKFNKLSQIWFVL